MPDDAVWGTIKARYESGKFTTEQLAAEHGVRQELLQYAIDKEEWQVKPRDLVIQEMMSVRSASDITEEMRVILKDQVLFADLLKQAKLQSRYNLVEVMLINKLMEVLEGINPDLPSASNQFISVVRAFKELTQTTQGVTATESKSEEDQSSGGLKIVIQNEFNAPDSPQNLKRAERKVCGSTDLSEVGGSESKNKILIEAK
jgi:hypothetical protein